MEQASLGSSGGTWSDLTRTAPQNAASIAGLLLTTETVVVERPEPKGAADGGMPGGGGMEGMY